MSASTSSSPYAQLAKRPHATTVTVRELIAKVGRGEVRIPPFQRPLRWRSADVAALLDSVWRGYPVGSLLFWKRDAAAGDVQIGGAVVQAAAMSDAWWLVDGQQRTMALAGALLDLDHGGDRRWALWFDPDAESFTRKPADNRVPVSVLGDLRRLGRWLRNRDLQPEQEAAIEEAQQRLLDYSLPVYVVETSDEQALRAIFARLNSSGARMRADEVFSALRAESGKPTPLDLRRLQHECDHNGFGVVTRGQVLKAVLAMSGQSPTRQPQRMNASELDSLVSFEAARDALTRAVSFLQETCKVPHVRLLPYPSVLVALARWFAIYPQPARATAVRLGEWVWRRMVAEATQRGPVSRRWVRLIEGDDEQKSLDRLMAEVGPIDVDSWALERFSHQAARSRIEMLALLDLGPRDDDGPVSLRALVDGVRVARKIFWDSQHQLDGDDVRTSANRILLDSTDSGADELLGWDPTSDEAALRSHLIDTSAYELLEAGHFQAFLRQRSVAVSNQVVAFMKARTNLDGPIVRPHEYYSDEALTGE